MEMLEKEVNQEFSEFLKTKGLKAKFKLAFNNIKESAKEQHELSKASFQAVKEKSYEENKDFADMLKTKGFKAKVKVIIEGFKNSAKASKQKTKDAIERSKSYANPSLYTIDMLNQEFNNFLKTKGLSSKYSVTVTEE